jgi:hypothetical protein
MAAEGALTACAERGADRIDNTGDSAVDSAVDSAGVAYA